MLVYLRCCVYLRWWVYGERPMPPRQRRKLFGVPRSALPLRSAKNPTRTQAVWEAPSPISPMACIWELPKPRDVYGEYPMPPRQDAAAIRSSEPIKDASCLGVPKPHISDGVYLGVAQAPRKFMGSTPCPQDRDASYSGCRARLCRFALRRTQRGRKLFGSPQAPYLRWRVFGSCPSPKMFMGSTPCPQEMDASYSGCRTLSKDASCLGVPKPQGCLWGVPHAPKQDAAAIRGAEPNMIVSFFTFHSFTFHSHLT